MALIHRKGANFSLGRCQLKGKTVSNCVIIKNVVRHVFSKINFFLCSSTREPFSEAAMEDALCL